MSGAVTPGARRPADHQTHIDRINGDDPAVSPADGRGAGVHVYDVPAAVVPEPDPDAVPDPEQVDPDA